MIDLTNLYCMKKAAIIIPVFNVDRYINECLKSVLSQTHKILLFLLWTMGQSIIRVKY